TRGGRSELLVQSPPALVSYDPATGKENWTFKGPSFNIVAMPVVDGDSLFAPGSATSSPLVALRLNSETGAPKQVWATAKLTTNLSSPLFYRGRLYAVNPAAVVNCADPANGKLVWQQRLDGAFSASPIGAGGHVYVTNEDGTTTVLRAGDEARVVSRNALDEPTLATPAISGGAIFLRTDRHLYCVSGK